MNNQDFVHLHVHSEYSLLDGLGSPRKYAEQASEMGFPALAVTDHGNIDGHLKWQEACERAGIRPVFGCELYVVEDAGRKEKGEQKYHVTVLIRNFEGWKALARMLTVANLEGFYGKPRIDRKVLLENVNDGMVILTGCAGSFLLMEKGVELLIELSKNRGIDCYLEVMPHRIPGQIKINELCQGLSRKLDIPLVATNDCHYVHSDHAKAQEVLLAIQRRAKWRDPDRWRFGFEGLHLRSADEMIAEFRAQDVLDRDQYYQAINNGLGIAEGCWDFEIPRREISLPATRYEREFSSSSADQILDWFCHDGKKSLEEKKIWDLEYQNRYDHELGVIKEKGFARYFLIVDEIITWCQEQEIFVGPGRGSVGGSLVAFLLGITRVDPLKYGLLFERFISPDRIDVPDVDIDFEDVKCDLVRKHIEEEYGQFNVAGISTFLTMRSKAVVRDVGRVFDLPVSDVDAFAKSIRAGEHDEDIVESASIETEEGRRFARKYPEEFRLMRILEGTIRGVGQHPAGLIVSGKDLRSGENGNLCRRADVLVCNWDMEDCEYNGLIKIDVLKLGTLAVLNEAKRLLKLQGIEINYEDLSLDDPEIFRMLSGGDTSGIFQFSGYAVAELCKKMGIGNFEDMAVAVALARPGPSESGMMDLYIRRKKGEQWVPLHSAYEAITKETYGVIVYQEQMMRAMTDLAGFSNSDADRVRKVIGKKRKALEFEPYREVFLKGCREKRTLTGKQVQEFWEGLLEWAHYGFVKAHAVEYAMIGYWTAFMKLYHPTEFFCAQLTYGQESEKKSIIEEAEKSGLRIVTPKVGFSDARRWVARDGRLHMPFVEIKGVGETQAEKCVSIRSRDRSSVQGFFKLKGVPMVEGKGKLEKLLAEVKAFDPDLDSRPDNPLDYFQFPIGTDNRGRIEIIRKQMSTLHVEAKKCDACNLRKQARQVVLSSVGMYNVLVLAESPGHDEDAEGKGLVGLAGQLFWEELGDFGITRRMLHVGNVNKCWPSRTKTPNHKEIDACFQKWGMMEILSMDCRLILATGNVPLYALTGRDSGISSLSGRMEWVEKVRAWVVWCVHPSAVLRSRGQNLEPFLKGIGKFAEVFKREIK